MCICTFCWEAEIDLCAEVLTSSLKLHHSSCIMSRFLPTHLQCESWWVHFLFMHELQLMRQVVPEVHFTGTDLKTWWMTKIWVMLLTASYTVFTPFLTEFLLFGKLTKGRCHFVTTNNFNQHQGHMPPMFTICATPTLYVPIKNCAPHPPNQKVFPTPLTTPVKWPVSEPTVVLPTSGLESKVNGA